MTRHYPTQIHECELCGRQAPSAGNRISEGQPGVLSLYFSFYCRRGDGRKLSKLDKVKLCSICLKEAGSDARRPIAIGSGRKLARLIIDRLETRYNQITEAKIA